MKSNVVREEVKRLQRYRLGKTDQELLAETGLEKIIRLDANESPWPPSPNAVQAVRDSTLQINRYPEAGILSVQEVLAAKHRVKLRQVTVGNGVDEIIRLITLAFLNPGEEVLTADLTFPIYAHSALSMGAVVKTIPLKNFCYDLCSLGDNLTNRCKLVFISNPNNPTGTIVDKDSLDKFMSRVSTNTIVVLDEAYGEYVQSGNYPDGMQYLAKGGQIIILRTLSKAYGLAGLRIGYALGPAELMDVINTLRPVFSVNSLAQAAAKAVLNDTQYLEKIVTANAEGRGYLTSALKGLGLQVVESEANFIFVNLNADAKRISQLLEQYGIVIRAVKDSWCRITIGKPEENQKLVTALTRITGRGQHQKKEATL